MRFVSHPIVDNQIYFVPSNDHFMHMASSNSTTSDISTSLSLSFVLQNALIPIAVVIIIFATTYGLWIYKSPNARKERRKCINFYYHIKFLFFDDKSDYESDKNVIEQLTQQLSDNEPGSPKTKTKQFSLMQKMKESVQIKNQPSVSPASLSTKGLRGTANIALEDLERGGSLTNRSHETPNNHLQSDQSPLTERSRFTLFFFPSSKSKNNSNNNLTSTSNKKRDFSKSAHVVINNESNQDRPVRDVRALSKSSHSYIPSNSILHNNHHHHHPSHHTHHHHHHHPVTGGGGKILAHQPLVPTSLFPSQKRKNSTATPYEPSSDVMSNLDSDHGVVSPSTSSKSSRNIHNHTVQFDSSSSGGGGSLHNSSNSRGGGYGKSISSKNKSNNSNKTLINNRPVEVSRAEIQSALYESRDDVLAANNLHNSRSKTTVGIKSTIRNNTNGLGGIDERNSLNNNQNARERQVKSPYWKPPDNPNSIINSNNPSLSLSSSARLKLSSLEMLQKQSSAYFPSSPNESMNNTNDNGGGLYTSAEQKVANNFLAQSMHRKTSQQFGTGGGGNLHSSVNMSVSGFQRRKSVQEPKKNQFGVESVFVDTSSQGYLNEAYNDSLYDSNEGLVGVAVSHQPSVPDFNRRGNVRRQSVSHGHSNANANNTKSSSSSPTHDDFNNHNSYNHNTSSSSLSSPTSTPHTHTHTPTPTSAAAGHNRRMSAQIMSNFFGIMDTSSATTNSAGSANAGIAGGNTGNHDRDSGGDDTHGLRVNNIPFSKSRTGSNAAANATSTLPRTYSGAEKERDPSPASQFVASLATLNIGRNSASRVNSDRLSNNIGNGGNGSNHSSNHNIMNTLTNNGSFTNRLFRSVTVEDKKENDTSHSIVQLPIDEESAIRNSYSAIYRNSPTGYETNGRPNPLTSDKG